jgi:DNA primase
MRGRDTVGVTFGYPTYRRNYNIETWPKEARVWLYKAGISNARIRELGWFYHNDSERVVLVVYDENNNEIYWQARSFDPERPKYINPQGTKAIFKHGSASRICITEDILSAVRVGESGIAEGWCIMGTSLTEKALLAILRAAKDVDIWLDPDAAGIKGARKFLPKLLSAGLTVRVLKSDRDPKLHSREEILAVLRCDTSAPS